MTQEINIPTWTWEVINMDLIRGLPRTRRQHDSIWVIVDRVTKLAHLVDTDGQTNHTIQTLEDILRACMIYFKGNWDDHLSLIEFTYINNFHSSIQIAPYEALYGRRCRSFIGWFDVGEETLIGPYSVYEAKEKVQIIRDELKTAQSHQKSYADVRRRDLELEIDDWVFLKVSPIKGVIRFNKKGKLIPRYVGPYRILKKGW
ncbi:hypothetical protein MTR67_043926 [Solanum verrucosum]|uniref:Tf2-1-like SH3-like domain-containing protein n=1 Tax=Solanum verrucosum TaxID=315347 RepID=A0AAF0USC3_SOLVR|nr:hypothetical protein MTR67_043926 [Solanum verrucosum]